jgi:hypothetical protein
MGFHQGPAPSLQKHAHKGLSDLEPQFDIRFVEKKGSETATQPIEKFPCVVGHYGNIVPLLLNGKISGRHCTVRYDIEQKAYIVDDGAEGKPSTNGIYFGDGNDSKKIDLAALKKIGDRVYLLRLMEGDEGFIELYDSKKEPYNGMSTQDLDPRLVRTQATAIEAHEAATAAKTIADENRQKIGKMEANLEGVLKQVEGSIKLMQIVGHNPVRVLIGGVVLSGIGFIAIVLTIFWMKGPDMVDALLETKGYKIDRGK